MIIAFSGPMGSGKTTALETLVFGTLDTQHKVRLAKLAQPLYDMQEFIYRRVAGAHSRPKNFIKDRKLLQFLGKEWGRDQISDTLWIDLWKDEALKLEARGYIVATDDVRFNNEAEAIRSLGGKIIKIESDYIFTKSRISTNSGIIDHPSEYGIDSQLADYTITNNGTVSEFQEKLLRIYKQILSPIKVQNKANKA